MFALPCLPVFIIQCSSKIAMTETAKNILKDRGVCISQLHNEKSLTSQNLEVFFTDLPSSQHQISIANTFY